MVPQHCPLLSKSGQCWIWAGEVLSANGPKRHAHRIECPAPAGEANTVGANDRRALTRYRHVAMLRRANVTPMHHIRFFRAFVMANTAESDWCPYHRKWLRNGRGIAMMTENQDIAPLLALLKMAADQWPSSEVGEVSQIELFRRDQALLKMWPE